MICPDGLADSGDAERIAACYAPEVIYLSSAQKAAFAGNCLSLSPDSVWMSQRAADSLTSLQRAQLQRAGFALRALELDEIEKAGAACAAVWPRFSERLGCCASVLQVSC